MTNDERYVKVQKEGKGTVTNMCVAMDKAEARGEARGEAKGVARGKVIAYDDLGTEAIRELKVEKFPVIVVIDSKGNNLYESIKKTC